MASSIGTCAKNYSRIHQHMRLFSHSSMDSVLPAASKNSISQLRERNVDRANLRSEVRPPGKGFRAKSRKEVSPCMRRLFEDCLELFSRPQTSSTRKAWTGASITKQKMICYQKKSNAENKNLHVLIRQSRIKRKSIKNPKNSKLFSIPTTMAFAAFPVRTF